MQLIAVPRQNCVTYSPVLVIAFADLYFDFTLAMGVHLEVMSDPELPFDRKSQDNALSLTTHPPCAQSHTPEWTHVKASLSTALGHGTRQHTSPLVLNFHVLPQCLKAGLHNELLRLAHTHMPWSSHPAVVGQGEK